MVCKQEMMQFEVPTLPPSLEGGQNNINLQQPAQ